MGEEVRKQKLRDKRGKKRRAQQLGGRKSGLTQL